MPVSPTPKYDLKEIQALCKSQDLTRIWFSAKSRSTDKVIEAYASTEEPKSYEEAVKFILQGIVELKPEDFVERVLQWGMVAADVYGLICDGRPWYVKFIYEDGTLEEISFHPPERPLKTASGIIIGG